MTKFDIKRIIINLQHNHKLELYSYIACLELVASINSYYIYHLLKFGVQKHTSNSVLLQTLFQLAMTDFYIKVNIKDL